MTDTNKPRRVRQISSEEAPPYLSKADDDLVRNAIEVLKLRLRKSGYVINSPADVKNYLILRIAELEHEVFGCLFLNSQHAVIADEELFRGTIDGASVYPREVVKRCLQLNAAAVLFYHNHPSGSKHPSEADKRLTKKLKDALDTVDIRVIDHIVVGGADTTSFAEQGLL